jgi:hypothetical protein
MRRLRRLGRGGRFLLAAVVGGAVFGIATAVQASIPDTGGVIRGCYNTSLAHGNPTGGLRVIDTSKPNGTCASWETPLNWNQTGPTGARGPTGAPGPKGTTGARGATGAKGVTGPKGATGAKGATGVRGPSGAKGATGARGPTGADGQSGVTGATGPSGPRGPSGSLGSFDDLAGLPCAGQPGGKISISYSADGTVTLKCGLPVGWTTLAVAATAGDTTITVPSPSAIASGDALRIDPTGANPETVTVSSALSGVITFTPALSFAHPVGTLVHDLTLGP